MQWSSDRLRFFVGMLFSKQGQQCLAVLLWCQFSSSANYQTAGMNWIGATFLLFFAFQDIILAKYLSIVTEDENRHKGPLLNSSGVCKDFQLQDILDQSPLVNGLWKITLLNVKCTFQNNPFSGRWRRLQGGIEVKQNIRKKKYSKSLRQILICIQPGHL